jgi:hypothetical protein
MAEAGLIGAYLEQLRSQLPRTRDADDVISEAEDHLHTIVEAHLALGLSEEAATRHALGAFGSADLVARAFAQQKGHGTAMPTTFTTYCGLAAILGGVTLGVCLALGTVTTLDVGSTTAWFAPVATTGVLLTIVGLIGIDARHRALYGSAGRIGRLLLPVGAIGLVASAATWFAPGWLVSVAAMVLALIALGTEVWRSGVLPRAAVVLVAVGLAGIPPASLLGNDPSTTWTIGTFVGMAVFGLIGAGLAWLGYGLWRERHLGISGGRPAATA